MVEVVEVKAGVWFKVASQEQISDSDNQESAAFVVDPLGNCRCGDSEA